MNAEQMDLPFDDVLRARVWWRRGLKGLLHYAGYGILLLFGLSPLLVVCYFIYKFLDYFIFSWS